VVVNIKMLLSSSVLAMMTVYRLAVPTLIRSWTLGNILLGLTMVSNKRMPPTSLLRIYILKLTKQAIILPCLKRSSTMKPMITQCYGNIHTFVTSMVPCIPNVPPKGGRYWLNGKMDPLQQNQSHTAAAASICLKHQQASTSNISK
jgi:hypothetical protein